MRDIIPIGQLEDPTTWDDESASVHHGVDEPQALVSTRFSQQELNQISEAAEARGQPVSAFIRSIVLHHFRDESAPRP